MRLPGSKSFLAGGVALFLTAAILTTGTAPLAVSFVSSSPTNTLPQAITITWTWAQAASAAAVGARAGSAAGAVGAAAGAVFGVAVYAAAKAFGGLSPDQRGPVPPAIALD